MAHFKTFFQRPDRVRSPLHVVTTVFNSARFRSRWRLYQDFTHMVENTGAHLTTVEVAFGKRDFALDPGNAEHPADALVQLRTSHELWLKENAINLGVARLPPDWEYVAWVDADVAFVRPDWADETVQRLQHYPVVQMWSEAQDMGSEHQVLHHWRSLAWAHGAGKPVVTSGRGGSTYPYPYYGAAGGAAHPGFAWAMRRDAWDQLGGLLDFSALGSADMLMGLALVGQVGAMLYPPYHPRYKSLILDWQDRAERHIRRNLGVVPGLVIHHWHGPKADRRYNTRNQILSRTQFNPDVDLKRDWQGLYQLADHGTPRSIMLRDDVRRYFHERNEDML